jgi:hypothetical protein
MTSKVLVVALVGAGCVGAAGIGAYVAVRSTVAAPPAVAATMPLASPAVVGPQTTVATPEPSAARLDEEAASAPPRKPVAAPRLVSPSQPKPVTASAPPASAPTQATAVPAEPEPTADIPAPAVEAPPPSPAQPVFDERTIAAASVIGIRMDTAVSSETARVEDRVSARVTRDVKVDGRTVIPAGARLDGTVTMVERGGKIRDRARVGVRFDTLMIGDTDKVAIQTETIFRDGESPTNEASSKIGASAVVGSILGAVLGGRKAAAIGGAAGAAGGTAAVMAGGRNAATIPAGTPLTVRLTSAVTVLLPHEEF